MDLASNPTLKILIIKDPTQRSLHTAQKREPRCQPQGAVPVFVSSLVFNGVTYTGGLGTSKKEAERLVARAAIQSLYEVPAPHHLPQLPSAVARASSAVGNSLISFVPATTEQQPIAAMSSGRKRRKNKKKANKKPRVDPQLPNAVMPFDQAPPCSVAK
ncbi:uncharacterized protein LOC125315245 [Rhodamnia argentea]|uniref:Uncharacterized protein LOC125315245 n=1 Tax=Rhodamnia argentea TaxID=178133 RepID=A0ABM3HGD7_9MYRT|nr:uncharacterized protein LOC125315245 [Rhodamnia argentea]